MYTFPRKFQYLEDHYFGNHYEISLVNSQLELVSSSGCIPALADSEVKIQPKESRWKEFQTELSSFDFGNWKDNHGIIDGFGIEVWITFEKRIEIALLNPNFTEFYRFRTLINNLTKCPDYPRGLLESEPKD